jgi:hypothetical protein
MILPQALLKGYQGPGVSILSNKPQPVEGVQKLEQALAEVIGDISVSQIPY